MNIKMKIKAILINYKKNRLASKVYKVLGEYHYRMGVLHEMNFVEKIKHKKISTQKELLKELVTLYKIMEGHTIRLCYSEVETSEDRTKASNLQFKLKFICRKYMQRG